MKRNRNSHSGFGLPLFISFNELAWLAVVGVVLIAAPQLAKGKQQSPDLPEEKEQPPELEPTLTEKNKFRHQLKEAEQELAQAKDQLEEAEQELENKNADATFRHAELIRKIDTLEKQLKETKQKLEVAESRNAELPAKIDALEKQLKSMEQERDLALAEERKLRHQLKETKQELVEAQNQPVKTEQVVRKELLGLKGKLENVGILLDRSSSMKKGNRWEESIQIVKTWLNLLPIENCFLIPYNDNPDTFQTNKYLPVSGPNGKRNRNWLIKQIRDIQPTGGTHIIRALAKAYEYPNLQTIILFTDGRSGNMEKIRQLCRNEKQSRGVTVNVVAIGDYFEEEIGEFLRNVAKETGGAFIGR